MFCFKCGEKVPDDSVFCPKCGQKMESHSEVKTIKLKCKNCNGTMEVDADAQEVFCPFCGAKEKILDSDAVAVEKIKNNTYKEIELAKISKQDEENKRKEKKAEQNAYRNGKLSKVTLVFLFIAILLMTYLFKTGRIVAGIITVIQAVIFATSWLIGMQIIREKKKFIYIALALIGFLLIIPLVLNMGKQTVKKDKLTWPDTGIAVNLPNPNATYGYIYTSDDNMLSAKIDDYTQENYEDYMKTCQANGFTVKSSTTSMSYDAYNLDGYKLSLMFVGDSMSIYLENPKSEDNKSSTNQGTTDQGTTDKESADKDSTDKDSAEKKTVQQKETDNVSNEKVDPKMKAMLDSYEKFIDEYIKFMKKYSASKNPTSMLQKYTKMTEKYADFLKKVDKYNTKTLLEADAAYYNKVTMRCVKKLQKASIK